MHLVLDDMMRLAFQTITIFAGHNNGPHLFVLRNVFLHEKYKIFIHAMPVIGFALYSVSMLYRIVVAHF